MMACLVSIVVAGRHSTRYSMPKKIFKKITPSPEFIRNHPSLDAIAHLLHDPNLFHLNRHSVRRAFAIGLGIAMLPIYGHMLIAAVLAVWVRANIAISVILVWISNPLTFPLMLVIEYWIGASLLGIESTLAIPEMSLSAWQQLIADTWKPLLLGASILSLVSAFIGYFLVDLFWRWEVVKKWQKRKKTAPKGP